MRDHIEYDVCPECGFCGVPVHNGKIQRHERGLGYVPYRLYHRIEAITGTSVTELVRANLCKASNKMLCDYSDDEHPTPCQSEKDTERDTT